MQLSKMECPSPRHKFTTQRHRYFDGISFKRVTYRQIYGMVLVPSPSYSSSVAYSSATSLQHVRHFITSFVIEDGDHTLYVFLPGIKVKHPVLSIYSPTDLDSIETLKLLP